MWTWRVLLSIFNVGRTCRSFCNVHVQNLIFIIYILMYGGKWRQNRSIHWFSKMFAHIFLTYLCTKNLRVSSASQWARLSSRKNTFFAWVHFWYVYTNGFLLIKSTKNLEFNGIRYASQRISIESQGMWVTYRQMKINYWTV